MNIFEKQKFFNELGFFTLCNAAPALGKFFNDTITISTPRTELISPEELEKRSIDWIYTNILFNKGSAGSTYVFFEEEDGLKLAKYAIEKRLRKEKDVYIWDELTINAIEEVMNILGGNMTEILAVVYGKEVELEVPELNLTTKSLNECFKGSDGLVLNTFTIYLGTDEKIRMIEVAGQSYYEELVQQLKKRV